MEKHITLPLTEEIAKTLRAGDRVTLTGTIYTSRDAGHKRMCEALARGESLPFDPQDAPLPQSPVRSSALPAPPLPVVWMLTHLP